MKKPIYCHNIFYSALRPLIEFSVRCHYRRMVIRGKENLPKGQGYIFAPCHQNAMMDPLVLLCVTPYKNIVFLCRSDIFAKPVANFLLTWLKILPVYRIRDGKENLSKNEEIFNKSREVLLHNTPLCLYSEGRHNNRHQLLPLVKGMFRIAGETQKEMGDQPLYIVPTGVDYDDYERPYSRLVVNIGKPIDIRPFMQTYVENEPQALLMMRDALTNALTTQMHHVASKDHYDEVYSLSNIANRHKRKAEKRCNTTWNRFITRKEISGKADALEQSADPKFEPLMNLVQSHKETSAKLGLGEKMASEHWCLPRLLLSTLILIGLIVAFIAIPIVRRILLFLILCFPVIYLPTRFIPQRVIKDPQFRSSINYAIRFGFSIIYTIIFSIICNCTHGLWLTDLAPNLHGFWWGLIAFLLAFPIAYFTGNYVNWLMDMLDNWKYQWNKVFHRREMQQLRTLQDKIDEAV